MPKNILISEAKDHAVAITLNRPQKKNALSIALRDELTDTLGKLSADPNVKVVVIKGSDKIFSAGFDLNEFKLAANDLDFYKKLWESSDRYHAPGRSCIPLFKK